MQVDEESPQAIAVPDTGGWATWQAVKTKGLRMNQGWHTIRIMTVTGSFNFDFMDWTIGSTNPVLAVSATNVFSTVKASKSTASQLQIWNDGVGTLEYLVFE